jgi:tetratricopeptide (TPR) repeat protein
VAARKPKSRGRAHASPRDVGTKQSVVRVALTLLVAFVLTTAAGWAYSTSFAGVFVFDDKFAITDNPNIRSLWPLTRAMSAPPEMPVSGRPVASLTLAINYALAPEEVRDALLPGGPAAPPDVRERFLRNVWGYHFLNLVLHILAALALFGVVRRTLGCDRLASRFGANATALALVISLIWIVHPLLTDAVTYVVQRTEVLMGLFLLVTLYCAIRSQERQVTPWQRRCWILGAIVACALGMGSKQTMIVAPLLVWLWDWLFGERSSGNAGLPIRGDRRVLYAGLAATWLILAALVWVERWPTSIGFAKEGWTPWTYLVTQSGVIVHYLRLSFVPWPLSLDYDGWPTARSILQVAPYALFVIVLLTATAFAIARRQPWGFVGAWFFALLAPSSSVLPLATEIAAERRMYLPLAAIVTSVVIGVFLIWQRVAPRVLPDARLRRGVGRVTAVAVVGAITIVLGAMTYARNMDFWSDEGIWRDTVEKRPNNPRARLNYGIDLYAAGRLAEAERELREAVRLKDTSAAAHANLGPVLCALGQCDEGVSHLQRALALDPAYTTAHGNLGEAYASRGQRALAAQQFALAVKASPDNPFLLNRLAWLLATSPEDDVRSGARAVELAEHSVSLTSRQDIMSLETLSAAYAEAGRFDEAVTTGREALALAERQGNGDAAENLARRILSLETHQKVREPN